MQYPLTVANPPLCRENHYVSCGYLKRWAASSAGRVWTYRTLVPHDKVPLWKLSSPRGVAYHSHLYTKIVAGEESDEIERWFASEFEAPAEDSLKKATSDDRLSRDDWRRLIRFLAAQDVRTPAWFHEQAKRWESTLPALLEEILVNSVRSLEDGKRTSYAPSLVKFVDREGLPLRVGTRRHPGKEGGEVGVEMLIGRGLWLWAIKRALTQTLTALYQHKWTILSPPEGSAWFTTDNPVVRLNYNSTADYTFGGGWGSKGTEIFLPIGPQHLMYTQIGNRPPSRGVRMPPIQAALVRRFTAEHAYRMVFCTEQNAEILRHRPRRVDSDMVRREKELWATWHEDQVSAEIELLSENASDLPDSRSEVKLEGSQQL